MCPLLINTLGFNSCALYLSLNMLPMVVDNKKTLQLNGKTAHQPKANSVFGRQLNKVLHDPAVMLNCTQQVEKM